MDCSTARALLEDYFEGTLPARRQEEVSAHVSECEACAAELAQIERVAAALAGAPRVEPSVEVLRAIAARVSRLPAPGARRVLVSGWRRVAVLAAGLVAVLTGLQYGLPLVWPGGAAAVAPAVAWLGKGAALVLAWLGPKLEAIRMLLEAAWRLLEPLGTAALAAGPAMGLYAAGELACVVGMILVLRWSRRRVRARVPMFVL